jgi:hypothetical protein
MKKLCHLFIVSLLLTLPLFVLSCSNGSSSDEDLQPDAGKRGIYLASPYAGLSDYMKKTVQMTRLTASEKTSSIPKIFLVKGSDLANMSEANMLLAVETCAEGNTFVVDAPTQEQVKAFKTKLDTFLDKSENEYHNALQDVHLYSIDNLLLHFIDADSGTMGAYEAIAMRKTQVYFVHDIDEVYTVDYSGSKSDESETECPVKDTQTKESGSKDVSPEDIKTDYTILFEESSENFAAWIKLIDSVDPVTQGGVNLNDAMKAQSFVHNFTATFSSNRDHYDGRYNGKSENVQVYVDVWSACSIDKNTDHYLVRTSCVCNNQQLGYANQWDSSKYVGPFFEYAYVTTSIEKASLAANDCNPPTSTGSTSFATSEGFSLSGNVGFNASGPTGGIGLGYSHTETTTRSIPDISIALEVASDSATWKYTTPKVDADWSGLVTKCDGAKSIQYNTAIFDTYAHYTMPSAEYYLQEVFPLVTKTEVSIRMLTGWLTGIFNQNLHTGWACRWTKAYWTDYVRKPSNSFREYIMAFEPPSGMTPHDREILANALKVYISDWGNSVRYYGIINTNNPGDKTNLDKIAKSHFAIAKKTIENNTKVLKDRGFSGTFKFYIKPADSEGELTSFTLSF